LDATALFKACNPKPTALFKAHVALVKASHFLALAFAFWPPVTTSTQEVPSPSLLCFFSQWPCCIGCGKGLGPCLPPPLPLPSPAFVLALAPFTGAGPVGSSERSVVSFCSLLLLLEELDSFSLGLDSWYLPGQKNDVGIFVQSRPHFFCDKTWIQKMAKKHPVQKF
jgi:hypothetical protein